MIRYYSLMRRAAYIFSVLFTASVLTGHDIAAQTELKTAMTDSAGAVPGSSWASLYAGGGYGSNMIYLGSTISQDNPYGYASLSFGFRGKLFASVSAVNLTSADPLAAFYIGSLTWSHPFNDWFDVSAGLYHYRVDPSLTDTLFASFTYGDVSLGFDWNILYTKISAGAVFSEESQGFYQIRNSRYFETPDFFRGKANISFDPYINLMFGNFTEITTTANTINYYSVPSPYRKWRNNGNNTPSGGTVNTDYSYSDRFGLLEIDFGLPVDFNTDFMTIGLEPSYVIPIYDDTYYPGAKGFVLSASVIFRIF